MKTKAAVLAAAFVLCAGLAVTSWAQRNHPCGTYDPRWQVCAVDSDCMLGKDACGWPQAYASAHQDEVAAYATCIMPMIECARRQAVEEQSMAVCENFQCVKSAVKKDQ